MSDPSSSDTSHYYALPAGTNLFEFRIEQVLGYGGFGITYLATDTNLDERVAIKEYLPSEIAVRVSDATVRAKTSSDSENLEQGLNSYLEEARTIARFRHRNIVHVRRFFRLNGTAYIVLEYEDGQTLAQYLETHTVGNDQLRALLSGVLDGLEVVHSRATLHRDLKPSNIILRPDKSPVLIDFGASRDFQSRNSKSVTAIATAGYSPPEQYIGGEQGPWTDLYALGAIAYRIVSGVTPPDSLRRLRKDPLIPASSLDVEYDPAILRTIDWMLKIDEAERPLSVEAVRDSLAGTVNPNGQNTLADAAANLDQNDRPASDERRLSGDAITAKAAPRARDLGLWAVVAGCIAFVGMAIYTPNLYRKTGGQNDVRPPISNSAATRDIAPTAPARTPAASSTDPSPTPPPAPAAPRASPTAPVTPTPTPFDATKVSKAGYDEQKLNELLVQCRSDASCNLVPEINARLTIIAQERLRYWAAQSPADYSRYLFECVACIFREAAQVNAARVPQPMPAAPAPPPPPPAPPAERWNAVAYVLYRSNGRDRVSVGYSGIRSSAQEAQLSAKSACERSSNGRSCTARSASNSGCYYIQNGSNRTSVRWGSGATPQEAQRRCEAGGYRCQGDPIGGCVD